VAQDLDHWGHVVGRPVTAADVEPFTWALAEMGRAVSAIDYATAAAALQDLSRRVAAWWSAGHDLLLTPTMCEPPPLLGEFASTPEEPLRAYARSLPIVAFTAHFNATGQPAISLPLYWNESGLPVGVQLVAAYGREDLLFRVAARLEEAAPWAHRRPVVWAG
jgi:amidase